MEHFPTRAEPGGKVLGRSPNDSVEFLNPRGVEIMLTAGPFPNLVFELLHRLGPHAPRTAGEGKPEKGVSLPIGGHFRFLPAQLEAEPPFKHLLDQSQGLFGLVLGLTQNHEVVGITHKPQTRVIQLPVQLVQNKVGQKRRDHAAHTIDNLARSTDQMTLLLESSV